MTPNMKINNIAAVCVPYSATMVVVMVLVAATSVVVVVTADSRAQVVEMKCGKEKENNESIYVSNFVSTMESISNQMQSSQSGKAVTGSGLDASYGLAQCHGDLSQVDCLLCYAQARTFLPQCYPNTGGRIFLDGCFMRGENYSFFQEFTGPLDKAVCGNQTRKGGAYNGTARGAVRKAVAAAVEGDGYARAAAATGPPATNESIYVLTQCWRTLSKESCAACLENASVFALGCLPWSEGRALMTGCFMRYSDVNFLNAEQLEDDSSGGNRVILVVALGVSSTAVMVGGVFGVYIWRRTIIQKKRRGLDDLKKMARILNDSSLNFKFSMVQKATGSFNQANKLGQGGFGTVYKGVLADGREIAVKRLFFNNRHRAADFYNEVNIISSVEHRNLVRLLGCSSSGPDSLLIYEFLPNESLDRYIFDPSRGKSLNWEMRNEIIIGTAEGLVYLHENTKCRIIHRDIKASNILLDVRFRAKIADFGLARTFQDDKSHISTAIAGTLGYMAPEYLAQGQLTEKADVYSFGVLLLEIATGRQNNKNKDNEYSESLVIIVWKQFQEGTAEELFDPNLMLHNYNEIDIRREVLRVMHIGLLCTQEVPALRPTMSMVLKMLMKVIERLPPPANPPFVDEQIMVFTHSSESPSYPLNSTSSMADMSHSSFYPR